MPSPLPYLKLWHKEFLVSTASMNATEKGCYAILLMFQWEDGFIPDDPEKIALMVGATAKEVSKWWPIVRQKFEEFEPGKLRQTRMHKDREEAMSKCALNKENGGKGGRPSKAKKGENENRTVNSEKPNGFILETETKPIPKAIAISHSHNHIESTQEEVGNNKGGALSEFQEPPSYRPDHPTIIEEMQVHVWPAYKSINGDALQSARAEYAAARSKGATLDEILAGIARYKAWREAKANTGDGFVPKPKQLNNWLREMSWKESYEIQEEGPSGPEDHVAIMLRQLDELAAKEKAREAGHVVA